MTSEDADSERVIKRNKLSNALQMSAPLAERMRAIAHEQLGELREVHTAMCFPLPKFKAKKE